MIRLILLLLLALVPWFGARAQTNAVFADVTARRIWYPTNLLELVPPGGTNGQALVKSSSSDWDVTWATLSGDGGTGVTDHGLLTGLADDDHTNYFNIARGDARYSLISHNQTLSTITNAGTAAAWNVPATGDANSTNVVIGTDTRLTNARTPTTHTHAESDVTSLVGDLASKASTNHASTHLDNGSDPIPVATASRTGLLPVLTNVATHYLDGTGAWSVPPGTGSGGGAPTNALYIVAEASTALNNERVLTNGTGLTWTDGGAGSTLTLAADFGTAAGKVTQGNDARLSQTTTRGDINVRGASADGRLAIGPLGAALMSDGTDPFWLDPSVGFYATEDFLNASSTATDGRWSPWSAQSSSGTITSTAGESGHPGILRIGTGTAASGAIFLGNSTTGIPFVPGSVALYHRTVVRLQTLSDGTETYGVKFGFIDTSYGTVNNGCWIYYTHSNNTGKWEARVSKAGSHQLLDSGLTVGTGWYRLEVCVAGDGGSCWFKITPDGGSTTTLTYTTSANMPTANLNHELGILKSNGTTVRYWDVDYCSLWFKFNSARL